MNFDDGTRKPWERMEGEPSRWFQRFTFYRQLGRARTIESTWRSENDGRKRPHGRPSRQWYLYSQQFQWKPRADAWDQHQADQAEALIEAKWRDRIMAEIEVLGRLSEHGRNDIGQYFKITERWTEKPLPTEEVIKEEEFTKTVRRRGKLINITATRYLVNKIVMNMDALVNPDLSYRVRKFADSPKNGMAIELYDAQNALQTMGRHHRLFDTTENNEGETVSSVFTLPADCIAPGFVNAYRDIRDHRHTEYLFYGGRGSTKSSFISLAIIYLLVNNPGVHALASRQVANTLRDSVYSQLEWAISELGLDDQFKCTTSPLEIEYKPTGQQIFFRGGDDPVKVKSIKPSFGAIAILWFEELPEFHGQEAIRNITQSAIRGTDTAFIFKSFNPPRTSGNWVNKYVLIPKENQYQHKSDYLTVPKEWLGQIFIDEAEYLKSVNPSAYDHEYLGEVNGLGDMIFENLEIRQITDDEISQFDNVLHGLDFGYFPHPAHYGRVHYDVARHTLYIFGEVRKWKTSNEDMYKAIVDYGYENSDTLICDSEDPKSIGDYRAYGASARGAEKGAGSVKYSMKWLQSLAKIVIDPVRAPYSVEEFIDYAYERTNDGELIESYPREKDDAIAATRYACNLIWRRRGM